MLLGFVPSTSLVSAVAASCSPCRVYSWNTFVLWNQPKSANAWLMLLQTGTLFSASSSPKEDVSVSSHFPSSDCLCPSPSSLHPGTKLLWVMLQKNIVDASWLSAITDVISLEQFQDTSDLHYTFLVILLAPWTKCLGTLMVSFSHCCDATMVTREPIPAAELGVFFFCFQPLFLAPLQKYFFPDSWDSVPQSGSGDVGA